jgi:ATP-dependent RNA helicase DeaD
MWHPGAENLETEEREAATGRSRNVVHILPQSIDSVPRFLTGPLERVDPSAGGTQLVVLTQDPESAVALAEAVLAMTGMAGIELLPVTSPRRAARLMKGRPVLAIAGTPTDLAELIRGTHLKLQAVRTVVLAWVDDLLEGDPEANAALELVMTELPKDAARAVVTAHADARVDGFVERYLRRARRVDETETAEGGEPVSLQYVTASSTSRLVALRRLLDDLDPPSAGIVVWRGEDEASVSNLLRALGLSGEAEVRVTRGEVAPGTHAVIFYGMPASRRQLAAAAAANPVVTIAIVQPRELPQLKRVAGGEVKPLTLSSPGKSARDRERSLRRELSAVLESGVPAREILALEPLLDRHDGIEIAAAALRLLERERGIRKSIEATPPTAAPRPAPPRFGSFDKGGRPASSRPDRGGRPPRDRS